ncbi:MAG: MFS transporter, partial [Sciscionella sp.]
MRISSDADASASRRIRSVLAIRSFRRLLVSGYLCSVGDWLALLALSGLATKLMHGYLAQNFAFSGVVLTLLLPGLLFAPVGGILADRFDRRKVMVVTDLARCGLFVSIAVVGTAWWLFAANFLIGCMSMLWIPAKDSAVPNLLRRKDQVETANQLGLVITYGLAVVSGAALYAMITGIGPTLHVYRSTLGIANIIVVINGALYLASALMIATRIPEISGHSNTRGREKQNAGQPGFFVMFRDGMRFAISTRLVRGLIIGMVGAFAAGGAVVGTGRQYALSLLGGDASFGMLFVALFLGLAGGMAAAPRLARRMTHNRLFGIAIVLAGLLLALAALSPQLMVSLVIVALVGACAGTAFLTGVTIIGTQVDDALRGRVNAVYQSLMKIILFGSTIVVPLLVGLMQPRHVSVFSHDMIIDGSRPVLLGAGLLAAAFGLLAYRQMGDRSSEPILTSLIAAIRSRPRPTGGWLIAVEGNTPADTSVQARRLADWLHGTERQVMLASDPC